MKKELKMKCFGKRQRRREKKKLHKSAINLKPEKMSAQNSVVRLFYFFSVFLQEIGCASKEYLYTENCILALYISLVINKQQGSKEWREKEKTNVQ